MKSKKKDSPETFFFGLKSNRFPPSANHPQTFLFDRELSTGFEPKDIPLSAMLEIFCYAVHGRVLGYKTYSNWIDESYDETYDDQLRFDKVVAVVESINAMSRVELSKMMKEMLPTLLHNIEHHNKRVNELEIEYNLFNEITETYKDYLTTQ